MTTTQIRTAIFNARRFSNYALAKEVAARQTYKTAIILGCDGKFWVPSTHRETGILVQAGYEKAA